MKEEFNQKVWEIEIEDIYGAKIKFEIDQGKSQQNKKVISFLLQNVQKHPKPILLGRAFTRNLRVGRIPKHLFGIADLFAIHEAQKVLFYKTPPEFKLTEEIILDSKAQDQLRAFFNETLFEIMIFTK